MDITQYLRKDLLNILPYSSARDEFEGEAAIWLDANENPLVTEWNRYPDPLQRALKQVISEVKGIPVNQLFLGNGSDEVLDLILRLTCKPFEDTVAYFNPSYGMYSVLARLNGLQTKEIPLDENFQVDLKALINQLTDVRLLFVCQPNNPTGTVFSILELKQLVVDFQGIVVVDEAYIDFCPEDSMAQLVTEFPNLIVVQTLSKAYGMAGLRIGMAIANEQWIQALNSIKPPYNMSSLVQQTAIELLRKTDWKSIRTTLLSERERLTMALKKLIVIETVFPSKANFILVRVQNANRLYQELTAKGIVVRNRSNQFQCENTLRFTIGTLEENNELINALNNYSNE